VKQNSFHKTRKLHSILGDETRLKSSNEGKQYDLYQNAEGTCSLWSITDLCSHSSDKATTLFHSQNQDLNVLIRSGKGELKQPNLSQRTSGV